MCFVSISISHNTCHMKFYFDSTKMICHELLFLMLIIYSEIQCFYILQFLCFAYFVFLAMEVLSGRELWGHLVQPPSWSRPVAKALSSSVLKSLLKERDSQPLQATCFSALLSVFYLQPVSVLPPKGRTFAHLQPEPPKLHLWPLPCSILSSNTRKSWHLWSLLLPYK